MELENTYRGKRVFLTGHTGFKGSWLLAWLHQLGADVKGYSLAPLPEHRLYGQIGGEKMADSVYDDILHESKLESCLLDFQPDFIFHLAAQPIVRTSYERPVETFAVNALGTAHLLNSIRKLEKPCTIVLVTTDKVYRNLEWAYAYRESDHLGGHDPYSASKACAELIIDSYRNSFFNPDDFERHQKSVVVARAGNVIGGGDWAKDRIIPDCIRALQNNESIPVRNPDAVRPWQHVLEPVYAYLLLGKKLSKDPSKYAAAYNFGPLGADCWTVKKMVEFVIGVWGKGSYHLPAQKDQPHEAGLLKLDINKAEKDLQWQPVFSAAESIRRTVDWYRNFDGRNAPDLLKDDIASFTGKLTAAIPQP
ncbi:MAG TPA: CDP-glucose 4,6-dehydratase [Puia sp.]|jgi:CDP-glucose 4,6-dehydratase|nr:CDP-glucose 4,6-dehydratase [Puia sp.]